MAKQTQSFSCNSCGAVYTKWAGRCESCGEWNSITEDVPLAAGPKGKTLGAGRGRRVELSDLSTTEAPLQRSLFGLEELDRVLGGGLVPASAILVGGDPGSGQGEQQREDDEGEHGSFGHGPHRIRRHQAHQPLPHREHLGLGHGRPGLGQALLYLRPGNIA